MGFCALGRLQDSDLEHFPSSSLQNPNGAIALVPDVRVSLRSFSTHARGCETLKP